MNRERRRGILVLLFALVTIVMLLGPLGGPPEDDGRGVEVLDDTLEHRDVGRSGPAE